jgi:hypothetical protein
MEEIKSSDAAAPPVGNPMATASLVLGIGSVVLFLLFIDATDSLRYLSYYGSGNIFAVPLFWLTSIPAIIFGHLALRRIGRIFRPVKGKGAARTGLALGYLMTFVVPVVAGLAIPTFSKIAEKGKMTKAISNCRQIITSLRLYSPDSTGSYPDTVHPDVRTANEAFHYLFVEGQADNEMIFGAPLSPYQPDGKIGDPPDFREALKPGENHWAMTRGLSDSAPGTYPLIFENPADASWPPKWNTNFVEVPKPGRVWKGGKIIIGMNDSSVALQKVDSDQGDRPGLKPLAADSKADLFSQNDPAKDGLKIGVLDVAR